MSRIGKKPIPIPKGVTVTIAGDAVEVQGPKGKMRQAVPPGVVFAQDTTSEGGGALIATLEREDRELGKFHGLARSLVANAVHGSSKGFQKELDIVGLGYRAEVKGRSVFFTLGYSHAIEYFLPEGIQVAIDKQTHLVVSGYDKQKVGQVAANMRALRSPDPYKHKGVRYTGERLKKKVGKTGAAAGAGTK